MTRPVHPFEPLGPEEIIKVCSHRSRKYATTHCTLNDANEQKAASVVRERFSGQWPNFRFITLQEPPKHEMVAYLESEKTGIRPLRVARVQVILPKDSLKSALKELIVDLDKGTVIKQLDLEGKHSYIDSDYMKAVEKACLADSRIQEEIEKLQRPAGSTVCVEPWAYATDGMNDMSERVSMVSCVFSFLLQWTNELTPCASAGSTYVYTITQTPTTTHIRWLSAPRSRSSSR